MEDGSTGVAILGIRGNKFMRESIFSVARINFLSVRHREALEKKNKKFEH
jgi:hypothetical protein